MGKRRDITDNGSWPYAEELFGKGDPAFVTEIRRITDADRLGNFALTWFTDQRPAARRLLLQYLSLPFNSFRHEALLKRLFKLADKAGDDEVMAHFLVGFDRSVRRRKGQRRHYRSEQFTDRRAAEARRQEWLAEGLQVNQSEWSGKIYLNAWWSEDTLRVAPGSAIWRPPEKQRQGPHPIDEHLRQRLEKQWLFTLATRRYLRRRAWRYFRQLGKKSPERYVPAMQKALVLYRDTDVADGLALIDNWGLVQVLFRHSPVLVAKRNGWKLAPDSKLGDLKPAPAFAALWKAAPETLFDLLKQAQCRPVRQWTVRLMQQDLPAVLAKVAPDRFFDLLASDDPEVVTLAADILREIDLAAVGIDRLLALLDAPAPQTVEILCDLLADKLKADKVTLNQAVKLAASRPIPAARLGFTWLKTKSPTTETECRAILGLVSAQAAPLRPELVRWARGVLAASPHFQTDWIMEYLDSRHMDVRPEGWQWLQEEPQARESPEIWRKLLESPYDDVRLKLIAELEKRVSQRDAKAIDQDKLDPELLRFLWASVLLNIQRGNRSKPLAIGQLVRRVAKNPAEASAVLPILAVALRSLRGPEWRAGLSGIVQLVERHPELTPLVQQAFPELVVSGLSSMAATA